MSSYRSRLVSPDAVDDINAYAAVWPSLILQIGVLTAVVVALYLAFNVLGIGARLPRLAGQALDVGLVALPVAAWALFTLPRERAAPQPRARLLTVLVISGLAANAIALPLIDGLFQVERWLPLSNAINRIIGYAFTVGITQEISKYIVIRYTAWTGEFRTRRDAIAYGIASAIGYATVLNLRFVLESGAQPDIVAAQMLANVCANLVGSVVVAYGLAELRFTNPVPFLMTIAVAVAALLQGVIVALRAGVVNASFSVERAVSAPNLLFGIALSLAVLAGVSVLFAFFFTNADRRAAEAAPKPEV